ncbi:hypothetical protein AC625_16540 [Peribacillus loiseleuriae]|uniref:Uncharacterized protein n=1 Tax=Peribacillus loiseleuriae TaxID=1679170 RepID=A0A0K9GWD0_9BACI|nr:hypothetical protein AC625_16540 [Peribacillus loiseleuriae]
MRMQEFCYLMIMMILSDWKVVLLHAAQSNASAMIHPILKRPNEKIKKDGHDGRPICYVLAEASTESTTTINKT